MVFKCSWDGAGKVFISGDKSSVTGIYADDGYTVYIQPSGATFDAPEHSAGLHSAVDLTSGMTPGLNNFTLIIQNWQGYSMWYGKDPSWPGINQTPYIVQVISDSPPKVTAIKPASGKWGTTVQITNMSGTGFVLNSKPTVQLVKNANTITATNITVVNPKTMTCTFTISPYAITGPWNVRVTNADMQYGVKSGAFTVES
jgi:hypothetical protein